MSGSMPETWIVSPAELGQISSLLTLSVSQGHRKTLNCNTQQLLSKAEQTGGGPYPALSYTVFRNVHGEESWILTPGSLRTVLRAGRRVMLEATNSYQGRDSFTGQAPPFWTLEQQKTRHDTRSCAQKLYDDWTRSRRVHEVRYHHQGDNSYTTLRLTMLSLPFVGFKAEWTVYGDTGQLVNRNPTSHELGNSARFESRLESSSLPLEMDLTSLAFDRPTRHYQGSPSTTKLRGWLPNDFDLMTMIYDDDRLPEPADESQRARLHTEMTGFRDRIIADYRPDGPQFGRRFVKFIRSDGSRSTTWFTCSIQPIRPPGPEGVYLEEFDSASGPAGVEQGQAAEE